MTTDPDELTPIYHYGLNMSAKRDDLFQIAGAIGGKARTCLVLAQGAAGLVTAGSRSSPQVNIVARIAAHLDIPCRCHVPSGELTPELAQAKDLGAEVVQHTPGRNSVIDLRARQDAERLGWTLIPFGMQCEEAVTQTRRQVGNLPDNGIGRIVVAVGSGMTLAGILHGLRDRDLSIPVLAVCVGANPRKRVSKYGPWGWTTMARFVRPVQPYDYEMKRKEYRESWPWFPLDSHYESKVAQFLRPRDLLWVTGIRSTESPAISTVGRWRETARKAIS